MAMKRLILGVGNDILMDDGIGPRVVKALEDKWPIKGVDYQTAALGGLELVELMNGYETVVFIDAIKTKGGVPGAVYEFTPADFKETLHLTNLHDINFLTALKLGDKVGLTVPKHVYIYAVEIIEDTVFGDQFTPPLKQRYPAILEEIRNGVAEKLA
jgi:hydrogenase maturation protease